MKKEKYHPTIYVRWEKEGDEVGVYKVVGKQRITTTISVRRGGARISYGVTDAAGEAGKFP